MPSYWVRLAASAAFVGIICGLGVLIFDGSATPAYAIEQTIEANRAVRYYHIRIDPAGQGLAEAWAQFDDESQLVRLRMDFPNSEDGAKVVIWEAGKAEVYFKTKQTFLVVREPDMAARFPEMLEVFDPKQAVEAIHSAAKQGRVKIETNQPSAAGDPIRLVATSQDEQADRRVFFINPSTKLADQIEHYRRTGNEYELQSRHMFLDYDRQADSDLFTWDIPAEVTRIDQTTQVIGLAKGDLTDEEIAVKVVREFFEASIAKDYAKAGQLFEGIPERKARAYFEKLNVVRIISIGKPQPHPDPDVGGFKIPCEVEIEKDGVRSIRSYGPAVRPVYSQPDRWTIHGGF